MRRKSIFLIEQEVRKSSCVFRRTTLIRLIRLIINATQFASHGKHPIANLINYKNYLPILVHLRELEHGQTVRRMQKPNSETRYNYS